jgi:DNA repair photolyase
MTDKIKITTDNGQIVDATAPIIISASRSTDIPAFYAKWLINRIKKGYVVWYNPFNQKPMYVSFQNAKVIVFWSKNPAPLIPYLDELDKMGIHYYFQYTLNDYEKEAFEPNVPPLEQRIETFKTISKTIGKEKVIWRFDPIIITQNTSPRILLKRIWHIGNKLKGYTDKLVFSFVDIKAYRKVQNNLIKETNLFSKETINNSEPNHDQIKEFIEGLVKIREAWAKDSWDISMATCAEDIDLDDYGIKHNRCIDGELMKQIFAEDSSLLYYLNYGKLPINNLFGGDVSLNTSMQKINLKDKGQRKSCGCMVSKDIGMYNTCRHHCVYCYANTSKKIVEANKKLHNCNFESLISRNF